MPHRHTLRLKGKLFSLALAYKANKQKHTQKPSTTGSSRSYNAWSNRWCSALQPTTWSPNAPPWTTWIFACRWHLQKMQLLWEWWTCPPRPWPKQLDSGRTVATKQTAAWYCCAGWHLLQHRPQRGMITQPRRTANSNCKQISGSIPTRTLLLLPWPP